MIRQSEHYLPLLHKRISKKKKKGVEYPFEAESYVADSDFDPLEVGASKWWLDMPYLTPLGYKKQQMILRPGCS